MFQWCRNWGAGGPLAPPPQYLADQLTLFQPGWADYAHHYHWPPPKVFHLPASVFLQKCNQVLQTATTQIDRLGELPDILLISAFLGFVRLGIIK